MQRKTFELEMKVRDYELDVQGIVNNANYLHYMENTRHEFLQSLGITFLETRKQGFDPVLVRADLQYKTPLTGGEEFISSLTVDRKGVKLIFNQQIYRKRDGILCCKGKIECAVLQDGKLSRGDFYDDYIKDYLIENG